MNTAIKRSNIKSHKLLHSFVRKFTIKSKSPLSSNLDSSLNKNFLSKTDLERLNSSLEPIFISHVNTYLIHNNGMLSSVEEKYIYGWLKYLGILSNIRFISYPNIGWQLVKFDENLNVALYKFIKERGTDKILKLLYLFTDILNFQFNEKPYYLITPPIEQIRIDSKDAIPKELVGKKVVLKNLKSINFDEDNGYGPKNFIDSRGVPTVPNTFEKLFLSRFKQNLSTRKRVRFYKGLVIQLKRSLPNYNWKLRRISYILSKIMFTLKFNENQIRNLAIRVFYDHYYYGGVGKLIVTQLRPNHKKLFSFFEKHYVTSCGMFPSQKEVNFIITVSSLGLSLHNFIKNIHNVRTLTEAYSLLNDPRRINTFATNVIVSTGDVVKAGLRVKTNVTKNKFMKEDNPYGITNYVLAAFNNRELRMVINQKFTGLRLPETNDLQLEFTGQKRHKGAYSPIYEDAIVKEKISKGLNTSISILVKRTDYERPERYIIDWLKTINVPIGDERIYTLVNVTHPLNVNLSKLNPHIIHKVQGTSCGIINIGIFEGFEGYRNLGVIFGSLDQARRKRSKNVVDFAYKNLHDYGFDNITKIQLEDFNEIYNTAGISKNLRKEKYDAILRFLKEWVKKYGSILSQNEQ